MTKAHNNQKPIRPRIKCWTLSNRSRFLSFSSLGFTIIELIISIVIVGILATITLISYNGIQARVASNVLKADLKNAAGQLEIDNFETGIYPASDSLANNSKGLPKSEGTVYQYVPADGYYCLSASSARAGASVFRISSTDVLITDGPCPFSFASALTATLVSIDSIYISWPAVSGATIYTLQQDTDPLFETATTIYSQSGTSYTSTGLSPSITYYYRVKAIVAGNPSNWSEITSTNTVVNAPPAPVIAVTLNSTNVLATIAPVTCSNGSTQYGIRSRTDDGTWSSYSDWSTTTTATQDSSQGVKYGYQAQARCRLGEISFSNSSTGTESTYIHTITAPAAPTVTANTVTTTTTWSWPAVTCPSGTNFMYQFRYTISPSGYDSNWTTPTDPAALLIPFTTTTEGQTYTVNIQAKCYTSYTASAWGASGQASYYRPLIPITSISSINGITTVGSMLSAGVLTPSASTATYQWQRADTSDGTYENISDATASTYTLVVGDYNKFIKVIATGSGSYSGTQTSAPTTIIIPLVVATGLTLNLDAGNSASYPGTGTTWTDLSGQGNNGTLAGSPTYSSDNGGSLVFNGTSQYISGIFSNTAINEFFLDASTAWTVSAWFNFPITPSTTKTGGQAWSILAKAGGIATAATLNVFVGSASDVTYGSYAPYKCAATIRGVVSIISPGSVNTGLWNNVTITWNGSTAIGYFNTQSTNLTIGTAVIQTGYSFLIGNAGSAVSSYLFEGKISNVKIYNRALTSAENTQNFNALRVRYGL